MHRNVQISLYQLDSNSETPVFLQLNSKPERPFSKNLKEKFGGKGRSFFLIFLKKGVFLFGLTLNFNCLHFVDSLFPSLKIQMRIWPNPDMIQKQKNKQKEWENKRKKKAPDAGFELALFEEEVVFETTALPLD